MRGFLTKHKIAVILLVILIIAAVVIGRDLFARNQTAQTQFGAACGTTTFTSQEAARQAGC